MKVNKSKLNNIQITLKQLQNVHEKVQLKRESHETSPKLSGSLSTM